VLDLSALETISESSVPQKEESNEQKLSRWYPRWKGGKPIYYGNTEAFGFALDTVGRAVRYLQSWKMILYYNGRNKN